MNVYLPISIEFAITLALQQLHCGPPEVLVCYDGVLQEKLGHRKAEVFSTPILLPICIQELRIWWLRPRDDRSHSLLDLPSLVAQ